tara:strand:- start:777 stop:1532 length:756 start_codon:yes stop_codon:yes gene_type:complete
MKTKNLLIVLSILFFTASCKTENKFPTDKKYWDTDDYENVVRELRFGTKPDEKLPTFDDAETKIIVEKLTDQENFKVVLDDDELGLKHKNEIGEKFFKIWQDMTEIYSQIDRKDIYVYEKERIEVFNFGLALQIRYFKLGNDEIKQRSDDPNAINVSQTVNSNVNTLIGNYMFYLNEINNEKSYSNIGLDLIAKGIDQYFTDLVNLYPNSDYDDLKEKLVLLSNKTKSENIKSSLVNLQKLIESKKQVTKS